jgi:hypothetical protein
MPALVRGINVIFVGLEARCASKEKAKSKAKAKDYSP